MTTSKPSMQLSFASLSSLPEDTHASLFPRPGSAEARKMTATSGRRCLELSESAGPLGSLQKMLLDTSAWVSTRCWLTWKAKTTPQGRSLFQLAPRTHRTEEIESGLWPTPDATPRGAAKQFTGTRPSGAKEALTLQTATKMWPTPNARDGKSGKGKQPRQFSELNSTVERMWPTPTAQDAKNNGGPSQMERNSLPLNAEAGGSLNPAWVEWLMGYPSGWTDLED